MRKIVPDELETLLYGNNNRAICWSKTCTDGGYMTQSMKNLVDACPECYQVSANNKILIENVDRSKIQTNLIQSCNTSNNTPLNNTPSNNTPQNNNQQSNNRSSKESLFHIDNSSIKQFVRDLNMEIPIEFGNYLLYEEDLFILFIFLLIISIIIIKYLFFQPKRQSKIFFR